MLLSINAVECAIKSMFLGICIGIRFAGNTMPVPFKLLLFQLMPVHGSGT